MPTSRITPPLLPIDECLPELLAAIEGGKNILLRAPTGAGKTTRVPTAIEALGSVTGSVVMLEPRRIAARAAARRMAGESGEKVGGRIGYTVRFDDKTSDRTTVRVVTPGIFLKHLQDDPFLSDVAVVIFDEFHERGVDVDLALAMTRRVQAEARGELRIVVMSATLQTDRLCEFLDNPAVIESRGRLHPVEVRNLAAGERAERGRMDGVLVSKYVRRAHQDTAGDVLVFLPGVGEIKRTARSLGPWAAETGAELFELYGDLPADRQDAVFGDSGRRKVVLATNIAETSITLPRITAVVDTGLVRTLRYDPASGLDRLELGPISRSSARQRCGRAGRTAPGICWQLWTAHDERSRLEEEVPEIERVDLCAPALQLVTWGETRLEGFAWFERPSDAGLLRARSLLERLGAIEDRNDGQWIATRLGKSLARLPLHPRLARLLLAGAREGVLREVATCAALLSERSPFRKSMDRHSPPRVSRHDSDLIDELEAIESHERTGAQNFEVGALSRSGAGNLLRVRDQIERIAATIKTPQSAAADRTEDKDHRVRRNEQPPFDRDSAISRALLQAFPDRLAARRTGDENRALMVGGLGVKLARECGVRSAELFLCLDVDGRSGEALVRRATAIDAEWLPSEHLETAVEYEFNVTTGRVEAARTTRFEGLAVATGPARTERNARSAGVLADAVGGGIEKALNLNAPDLASFRARVACLRQWMPELELPDWDDALLGDVLLELCEGRISIEELRKAPLLGTLQSRLTWQQRSALDEHAPERIEVPSGNRITLTYERDRPPVLAARIQELFGWTDSPTVARGRIRVLLHLLAPNMRPQQVTDDLRNFWDTTYEEVRKELRQRYPKHDWPEDPWTATPSRRPRRPRRNG